MKKSYALIGMPGCGKTTIGEMISNKLGINIIDLDKYIEEKEGKSISDMFSLSEDVFRDAESRALKSIEDEGIVLSTGGGIIKREENRNYLRDNYITIFIDRPLENILSDIEDESRPLLKNNKERLKLLYKERYNLYLETCHIHVVNNRDINTIVDIIKEKISIN